MLYLHDYIYRYSPTTAPQWKRVSLILVALIMHSVEARVQTWYADVKRQMEVGK